PNELRYHALFVESAGRISKRELELEERRQIQLRAARWFEQRGQPESAIELLLKAGDDESAVRVSVELCRSLMNADYFESALFWLRRLPIAAVLANDEMSYWMIRASLSTGSVRDSETLLAEVEPRWLVSDNPLHRGFAASTRALTLGLIGRFADALRHCYLALEWFPPDRMADRFLMWVEVMIYEGLFGNDVAADGAHRQIEQSWRRLPSLKKRWMPNVEAERSIRYGIRGDLVTAEALLVHQLHSVSIEQGGFGLRFHHMLAGIYFEWNQLDRASTELTLVLDELAVAPRQFWRPGALTTAAQLHWARNERAQAEALLQTLFEEEAIYGAEIFVAQAEALQALFWLKRGQIELTRDWFLRKYRFDHDWPRVSWAPDASKTAVAYLLAIEDYAEASALARNRIAQGEETRLRAHLMPLYLLDAAAQSAMENDSEALTALSNALAIAIPGRFVRSLFPAAFDLLPLLARIRPRLSPEAQDYLSAISLIEVDAPAIIVRPASGASAGVMSDRERDVLELMALGLPNRQIGERLFIGERTVKMHVGNILGKLGVKNRTSAVARARELGLIGDR
ncbi:MAG: LuxR C-terminal-related transcriptional regulator, partial [Thermomicrobiales bacterium]